MKVTVKVEGLREIKDALNELPKATAKNVMLRVLKTWAEPIADAARQLAPVDKGDLKRSIRVLARKVGGDAGKPPSPRPCAPARHGPKRARQRARRTGRPRARSWC